MVSDILGLTGTALRSIFMNDADERGGRIKENAETSVSDEAFHKRSDRWPTDTPDTKEGYYIRDIFEGPHFAQPIVPAII